jgi:hypothetical protein
MKTGAPKSEFPAILGWCETLLVVGKDMKNKDDFDGPSHGSRGVCYLANIAQGLVLWNA